MAKSVSIPLALSEVRGGSARIPPKRWTTSGKALDGFVLFIVEKDEKCALYGSAAESAGVSVGDEVVGVNGVSVEGKTHLQLVSIIQQCIRTKSVALKIRRRKEDEECEGASLTVKEALLVAVKKDQSHALLHTLQQSYPSVSAYDMEEVADGGVTIGPSSNSSTPTTATNTPSTTGTPTTHTHSVHGNGGASHGGEQETEIIKRYDDEMRERRERQTLKHKENQLLRSSLRASKKLKALATVTEKGREVEEEGKRTDNADDAHTQHAGECVGSSSADGGVAAYANECYMKTDNSYRDSLNTAAGNVNEDVMPMEDIILSVERIAQHLSDAEGREGDSTLIRQFFSSQPVRTAMAATREESKEGEDDDAAEGAVDGSSSGGTREEKKKRRVSIQDNPSSEQSLSEKIRIVTLHKGEHSYLGATVRVEGERVVVGRIVAGGMAESSALIHEGDEMLEVNGLSLRGRTVAQVCDVLRSLQGDIRIVLNIEKRRVHHRCCKVKQVRALYDYDPRDDVFIPCRELGVSFHRGDVLHVLDWSDDYWWQATVDGQDSQGQLARLIPSPLLRQHIAALSEEGVNPQTRKEGKKLLPLLSTISKKRGRQMMSADENSNSPSLPSCAYEEVCLHLARSTHKRTLVLCAVEGVGSLQLRQTLLDTLHQSLQAPVPYTSRAPREGEVDGIHYHFVTRQRISEMNKQAKLIEFGEYEKNLYGTALEDIENVRKKGMMCVMTLKAQSLWSIRCGSVMPFVVWIAPESVEALREQRRAAGLHAVDDDTLTRITSNALLTHKTFGHLFDYTIVNSDVGSSIHQLCALIRRLDTEPFWVPSVWVKSVENASPS